MYSLLDELIGQDPNTLPTAPYDIPGQMAPLQAPQPEPLQGGVDQQQIQSRPIVGGLLDTHSGNGPDTVQAYNQPFFNQGTGPNMSQSSDNEDPAIVQAKYNQIRNEHGPEAASAWVYSNEQAKRQHPLNDFMGTTPSAASMTTGDRISNPDNESDLKRSVQQIPAAEETSDSLYNKIHNREQFDALSPEHQALYMKHGQPQAPPETQPEAPSIMPVPGGFNPQLESMNPTSLNRTTDLAPRKTGALPGVNDYMNPTSQDVKSKQTQTDNKAADDAQFKQDSEPMSDFMARRYKESAQGQDAYMNAMQQGQNKATRYDGWNRFLSNVIMPGIGGLSRNPQMGAAMGRQSAGINAQLSQHAQSQQKINEMRTKQQEDAYNQYHNQQQVDETHSNNAATQKHNTDTLAETHQRNQDIKTNETADNSREDKKLTEEIARNERIDQETKLKNEREFKEKEAKYKLDVEQGRLSRAEFKEKIAEAKQAHLDKEADRVQKKEENESRSSEAMLKYQMAQDDKKAALAEKDKAGREATKYNPKTKQMERVRVPEGQLASEKPKVEVKNWLTEGAGNALNTLFHGGQPATAAQPQQKPTVTEGGIIRPPGVGPLHPDVKKYGEGIEGARAKFHTMPASQQAAAALKFRQIFGVYP